MAQIHMKDENRKYSALAKTRTGLSIKGVRSQRGYPVRTFFGQAERKVSSNADICTFLVKTFGFFGSNFLRFCADVFYGRPLIAKSYVRLSE